MENKEGSPIRILHVLGALDRGGAETMVMNLYRNIDRTKIQFDFIIHTQKNCDYNAEIKQMGGKIYSLEKFKGYNLFDYIKQFNDFFKNHSEYKVVHGHMRSTASLYLSVAKKYNMYTVAHSHNTSSGKGLSAFIKNILQYPLRYIADYFFACSKEAGIWLFGKKKVNSKNFAVIKNAIDIDKFLYNNEIREEKRKVLNVTNQFVLGNVARFHEQKNHEFLIELFDEYIKINPNSILVLVGEGDLKKRIRCKVNSLGIDKSVIFLNSREDINELMQAFDVFLFPSKYEGLGIVAIEAQCASLPVIASINIPRDVEISQQITFLETNNRNSWIKELELLSKKNRTIKFKRDFINSGYDINETTKFLSDFYINKNF